LSKNGSVSAADWCSKCGNFCDSARINGVFLSACCAADILDRRPALGTIPIEKITEAVQKVANARQEGGTHYLHFAIQPIDFIQKNGLEWCQGNIVKYVCRYKHKGGLEDLKKARHYLDKLIELEEAAE
jgi:hypothetical protein